MPERPQSSAVAVLLFVVAVAPRAALAWNYTGHRVIASIAYRELDQGTRERVAAVLLKHPAYNDLWAKRPTNGPNATVNLFWNASVFPDDARRPPWDTYNHPKAHYVNYRILADQGNKVEPPVEGENVINSYVAHLRAIRVGKASDAEKAVHLSWVFHQAGDIHQPLHAVARCSKAFPEPEGDKGGNGVSFPNPRGRAEWSNNLHAYWDDLLGNADDPAAAEESADQLIKEHPRAALVEELWKPQIQQWAEEGVGLSLKTVYNNLDPNINRFDDRPIGYEADALRVARRRAALAGYRLADELKRLFPGQ